MQFFSGLCEMDTSLYASYSSNPGPGFNFIWKEGVGPLFPERWCGMKRRASFCRKHRAEKEPFGFPIVKQNRSDRCLPYTTAYFIAPYHSWDNFWWQFFPDKSLPPAQALFFDSGRLSVPIYY